jgi:hypothetical protein
VQETLSWRVSVQPEITESEGERERERKKRDKNSYNIYNMLKPKYLEKYIWQNYFAK